MSPPPPTPPAADRYHPVPLQTLRPESIPAFSLFLQQGAGYTLYRNPRQAFTSTHRDDLLANDVSQLYVSHSDFDTYLHYVEEHLAEVMGNATLTNDVKSRLLYSVGVHLIGGSLTDPQSPALIERADRLSRQVVDHVLEDRHALSTLMAVMNSDDLRTHSVNVCLLSVGLAISGGLSNRRALRDLAIGALFHDIGKTELPSILLARPDGLTPAEMAQVRKHVQFGEKLLQAHDDVPPESLLPVALHHEALDGTGYPRGLRGDEIHPYGRMIAIANSFDALTTTRPYRDAVTGFVALSSMTSRLKARYDQALVRRFIQLLAPTPRKAWV